MKKLMQILFSGIIFSAAITAPLSAAVAAPVSTFDIDDYAKDIPGYGLIADSIKFDGIKISNFHFDNDKKVILVKPGEEFNAHMHYSIDASALKTLHRHHLIIGLHEDGPQECIVHSFGIKDADGDAVVTLKAPKEKGSYQVRCCHSEGLTDHDAKEAWRKGKGPSGKTILALVVVR